MAEDWTITHDPLARSFGGRDLYVDIGAERRRERIAVEIKSFWSASALAEVLHAVGQHDIDRAVLASVDRARTQGSVDWLEHRHRAGLTASS